MTKVRVSHGLRQLLSEDPGSFLLYAIEQVQARAHYRRLGRVLRHQKRRKYEIGWLHVSDLYESCDRKIAARLLGYELPRDPPDPKLQRIFDTGTYMHLRYQNYFLSLSAPFEVEIAKVLRHWPIVGEADVIVSHPELGRTIVELKSMNGEQFKSLQAPQPSHVGQLNGYLGLYPEPALGLVWYECKNTQAVKIFNREFDLESFATAEARIDCIVGRVLEGHLPLGCGNCGLDDYIGELQGIESRIEALAIVREMSLV